MPTVSVVMPVFNGEKYLAEAIDSILAQTLTDFELLVVDDASQDSSAQIIRSYQERDSRIRFYQLEQNLGAGAARNRGIEAASGDYIVFMDCDDVSLPQRLEKQATFLESHPQISLLGTCGLLTSSDLKTVLHSFRLPQVHCLIVLDMFVAVGFIYSTLMLRQNPLRAIGGFETGRRHGEDRELPWRLLCEKNVKFANLPENLMLYRRHEQSTSLNRDAGELAESAEVQARMLRQLWQEAPPATLDRFQRMAAGRKLNWPERRSAKVDLRRLIEALLSQRLVEPRDRPLLLGAVNRKLEAASPRPWQQFCHWRRRHFQRPSAQRDEVG
ncbi:MAG: glycosyltransferase family A protein [Chloroflexi bacterium]|nr:glycosyltransferase family A protein [Chloroflexota bacterium]